MTTNTFEQMERDFVSFDAGPHCLSLENELAMGKALKWADILRRKLKKDLDGPQGEFYAVGPVRVLIKKFGTFLKLWQAGHRDPCKTWKEAALANSDQKNLFEVPGGDAPIHPDLFLRLGINMVKAARQRFVLTKLMESGFNVTPQSGADKVGFIEWIFGSFTMTVSFLSKGRAGIRTKGYVPSHAKLYKSGMVVKDAYKAVFQGQATYKVLHEALMALHKEAAEVAEAPPKPNPKAKERLVKAAAEQAQAMTKQKEEPKALPAAA